jgi:hypothetical protein
MGISYVVGHEHASTVYRVYSVSTDNISIWIFEVYKGDRLRSTIYVCYSWETALNFNVQGCKGIGRQQGKLIVRKFM